MTKTSLTDMQAMVSTPLALISAACFTYPGRWLFEHVGVNAPGTEKNTTFLPPKRSWVDDGTGAVLSHDPELARGQAIANLDCHGRVPYFGSGDRRVKCLIARHCTGRAAGSHPGAPMLLARLFVAWSHALPRTGGRELCCRASHPEMIHERLCPVNLHRKPGSPGFPRARSPVADRRPVGPRRPPGKRSRSSIPATEAHRSPGCPVEAGRTSIAPYRQPARPSGVSGRN